MNEKSGQQGLRGVTAGTTAISTVGKEGVGLTYRGYDISDLAEHASFEEVVYLLLDGELPGDIALAELKQRLADVRALPPTLRALLELLPASSHPMDVLRTACSALGQLDPEVDFGMQMKVAERLVARMPGMVLYWHGFSRDGVRRDTATGESGAAAHFLHLLHGRPPELRQARALDICLILYAEHEFNASTFAARVCAATLSDFYSAVTAAIGTLRGPLHGGANEAASQLIDSFASPALAQDGVMALLQRGTKIMGFGHAIYKIADPRSAIVKRIAKDLAVTDEEKMRFAIAESIESVMQDKKGLFPNLDFYSALAFRALGVPTSLFTPLFACARIAGWSAHIMEQRAANRLIRPVAEYVGPEPRSFVPSSLRASLD